jgi:hypothetical protein
VKVLATQIGQYDQILREPGEVFELLKNEDGSDPLREDWVPKLDEKGKDTGEGEYVVFRDKHGNTVHRDYAPDHGEVVLRSGPKRGETHRFGWMQVVPEETVCGIYPAGTQFDRVLQLPQPRKAATVEKIQAPIKGTTNRPKFG